MNDNNQPKSIEELANEHLKRLELNTSINEDYARKSEEQQMYKDLLGERKDWYYDPSIINPSVDAKPVMNYGEYERLGVTPVRDSIYTEENFWQNQSPWEKAGNAAYRFAWNTLYDTVGGFGAMLDVEDYYNTDDEVGNALTRWAAEGKEATNLAAPIYKPSNASVGNFAWWMDNGSALASSIAAFGIQGMATGALFKGIGAAKMLGQLAKTGRLGKAAMRGTDDVLSATSKVADKIDDAGATLLDKTMTAGNYKLLESAAQGVDNFGVSLMLNQAESVMTASEIYNNIYNDAKTRGYADDYSRTMAANAATHSINLNRANIALNLTSADMFMKGLGNINNIKKAIDLKSIGKRMVGESLQEAGEELVNLAAQKQGELYGQKLLNDSDLRNMGVLGLDKPVTSGYKGIVDSYQTMDYSNPFGDATFKEGFETALLGAIGGAGQTALVSGAVEGKGAYLLGKVPGLGGLLNETDARYTENQYYADGSLKAAKGDIIYKTKDATYRADVLNDDGTVRHKQGDTIFKYSKEIDPDTGEFKKEALQEVIKDTTGAPESFKVGEVDDQGKATGAKAKKFSRTDLYNYNLKQTEESLNAIKDQTEKMSRLIGGARIQNQIERTIAGVDDLVLQGTSISKEDKDAVHKDLAELELLNSGTELTEDKVKEKALEYESLNERDLRKKQDELMEMSLAQKTLQALELNSKEVLVNVFKEMQKLNAEQAAEKGYGADYKQQAQQAIDKINEYDNMFQEYRFKHNPRIARSLFLNRIKRENLGTSMLSLDEEMQTIHDQEYKRWASENNLDPNDFELRDKYDQAFQLEKQKQIALAKSKKLKKLNEERRSIQKELNDIIKKQRSPEYAQSSQESLAADQKRIKELNARLQESNKSIADETSNIVTPINEAIKALNLKDSKTALTRQGELNSRKLELVNSAIQLDEEFDRLRSKKGEEELERQELQKMIKSAEDRLYKQYIQQYLDLQKEDGSILYQYQTELINEETGEPYTVTKYIKGKLQAKDGKFVFTTEEESFVVPEQNVNAYQFLSPARKEEIQSLVERILELQKNIDQAESDINPILDEVAKNRLAAEDAKSIDDLIEMFPSYKNDLIKDGEYLMSLPASRKFVSNALLEKFNNEYYITSTDLEGNTVRVLKTVDDLNNQIKDLESQIDLTNYYTVTKGEQGTEDEGLTIISSNSIDIPMDINELINLIPLNKDETNLQNLRSEAEKILLNKVARIARTRDEKLNVYESATDEINKSAETYNNYIEQLSTYRNLLNLIQRGEGITSQEFEKVGDVAELRMLQIKMQDFLVTSLTDKIANERRIIDELEQETNDIKFRINNTDKFISDQRKMLREERTKLRGLEEQIKAKKKQLREDKVSRAERQPIISELEKRKEMLRKSIVSSQRLIESAKQDIHLLKSRQKQLNEIASTEKINEALERINSIKETLNNVNQKGFNADIFKIISQINSLSTKKKELAQMANKRQLQVKALEELLNSYTSKLGMDVNLYKSFVGKRNALTKKYNSIIDDLLNNPDITEEVKSQLRNLSVAIADVNTKESKSEDEFLSDDYTVDYMISNLYNNNVISEDILNELMSTWTQYKSISDMIEIRSLFKGTEKEFEQDNYVNIINKISEDIERINEEYQNELNEIDEISMELDKLRSIDNSTYTVLTPEFIDELSSKDAEGILDFDSLITKSEEALSKLTNTAERIINQRETLMDTINKSIARRQELENDVLSLQEIAEIATEEYRNIQLTENIEAANEFINRFSRVSQLQLIESIQNEIDNLDNQIFDLRKMISLTDTIIAEELDSLAQPNVFRGEENYERRLEELNNLYPSLANIKKRIDLLKELKENMQVRMRSINDIYNRQNKSISELIKVEDEVSEEDIVDTTTADEFTTLMGNINTIQGVNKIRTFLKNAKNGSRFYVNEKEYYEKTGFATKGNRITVKFKHVVDGETKDSKSVVFDTSIENNKRISQEGKPALMVTNLNILEGTKFVKAAEQKAIEDKKFPQESLDPSETEDTGSVSHEDVLDTDPNKNNVSLDRNVDARLSIYTSSGKSIKWENKSRVFNTTTGLSELTGNQHELRWFNTLNQLAKEEGYESKYAIQFVATNNPMFADIPFYNEKGDVVNTYGKWSEQTDQNGMPNLSLLMLLVDKETGAPIMEGDNFIFVNAPKNIRNLTEDQKNYALSQLRKTPKFKSGAVKDADLIQYYQNELNTFRSAVLDQIGKGDDVIVNIEGISPGHEFTSKEESSKNFFDLLDAVGTLDGLKFGGDRDIITEKSTKPGDLFLKVENSFAQLSGRKINDNDIDLLKVLFKEWVGSGTNLKPNIAVTDGSIETEENIFKLINNIIYYNNPKKGTNSLGNYQMRTSNNILHYKTNKGKELKISFNNLSTLDNETLNAEQKEFIDFLKSMRRQLYKKRLKSSDKHIEPIGITSDGKIIIKEYNNYKEFLQDRQYSPVVTKTTFIPGTKDIVTGRYVSFDPSSVEVIKEPVAEEEETFVEETEEEVVDKNVGRLSYDLSNGRWVVNSLIKDGKKYSVVQRLMVVYDEETGGISLDTDKNTLNLIFFEDGKHVTDENRAKEIEKMFPSNYQDETFKGTTRPTDINVKYRTDKPNNTDLLQANIDTNPDNNTELKEIQSYTIPAIKEVKTKPIKTLSYSNAIEELSKTSSLKKYVPLLNAISFSGKVIVDPNLTVGGAYLKGNDIVIERLINETNASNLVHELTHAGTLEYLKKEAAKKESERSPEYKRLKDIHRIFFDHVAKLIKDGKGDYYINAAGPNIKTSNLQYILFGGVANKMSNDDFLKAITEFKKDGNTDKLYKTLLDSTEEKNLLSELVTYTMSNKGIQDVMNNIKLTPEQKQLVGKSKNLWDALIKLIQDVFGIKAKDGYLLKEALEATADIMDNLIIKPSGKVEITKTASDIEARKVELNNLKNLIFKTNDLTSIMDDIFKVLDEKKYETWQETLDQKQLENDLKNQIVNIQSEKETYNIVSKYLLPKFIDTELAALEQTQPVSDIEAKKADIKERRKKSFTVKNGIPPIGFNYLTDSGYIGTYYSPDGTAIPIEGYKEKDVIEKIKAKYKEEEDALEKIQPTVKTEPSTLEKQLEDRLKELARIHKPADYMSITINYTKLKNENIPLGEVLEKLNDPKWIEDSIVPFSPITDSKIQSISFSDNYNTILTSSIDLFNRNDDMTFTEKKNAIKTVLNAVLDNSQQLDLIEKVLNANEVEVNRIKGDNPNLTDYEVAYQLLPDVFDSYLNNTLDNKGISNILDEVGTFYNDNIVNDKLQNYHNSKPSSKIDKDSLYSPILDTKIQIEGVELTQEESTAIMDGMTFMLFDYFKNQDADTFFAENVDWFDAYKQVREKLNDRLTTLGKSIKEGVNTALTIIRDTYGSDSTQYQEAINSSIDQGIKLNRLNDIRKGLFLESYGDTQWIKAWKRHADRMQSYGVSYDLDELMGQDETESVRDKEFNRVQGEENEKDKIPPAVKLWLATRNDTDSKNILGFPVLMDFNDNYNYVISKLAGLPADAEIMRTKLESELKTLVGTEKVSQLSPFKKLRYNLLTSVLEPGGVFEKGRESNASGYEFKLLNQIVQTFSKQKPTYYLGTIKDNGDIVFFNSNSNKSSDALLKEWEAGFIEESESTNSGRFMSIQKVNDAINVINDFNKLDPKKRTDVDKTQFLNALKSIGISISNFDEVNNRLLASTDKGFVKTILDSVVMTLSDQIKKAGTNAYLPQDFNLTRDRNIAGTMKLLADVEADVNQVAVNNQFIAVDGQTNYNITLNHLLSLYATEINYIVSNTTKKDRKQKLKEQLPFLFNVFNSNSILLNKIVNDGIKIENSIFNGLKLESKDGKTIKDLGEANRWSMLISSSLNKLPIHTFYRAADRTTESGFRFTDINNVPVNIFGEDANMNLITKNMIGYLKDEMKAIYYHSKLNVGKDIMYYSDNGGKFKYFSDDKLTLNLYQDTKENLGEKLLEKIKASAKVKTENVSDDLVSEQVDKIINKILEEEGLQNNLVKSFKQYFQRKAYGYYYNDNAKTDRVDATTQKQRNKDRAQSVKGRIEKLGLLKVVPNSSIEYDAETGTNIVKEYPRNGKQFAGISSDIFNKYITKYDNDKNAANYNPDALNSALEELLEDFEALQFAGYAELGKIFAGDPSMFKNQDDFFKRMAMINSTKKVSIIDQAFNNYLNNNNSGRFYITHNGIRTYLPVKPQRADLNKSLDKLKKQYSDRITNSIKDISFLSNYTINDVQLELDLGYKKDGSEWKNTFTSIIFDDIQTMSDLAFEDGVVKINTSAGQITYEGEGGVVIEASKVSPLVKAFAEDFVKNDNITDSIKLTNKVLAYVSPFRDFAESDAQAYTTLDGYKEILLRSGDWTDKHQKAYSKIQQGLELDADELMLFPVLKTQYAGPLSNTPNLYVPTGYKHSVFPLLPQLTKATRLDALRKMMEDENVTLANMISANKFGVKLNDKGNIMRLYNDKGEFVYTSKKVKDKDVKTLNDRQLVTQDTEWKWFGVQVDQAPKLKKKVPAGTQDRKLALSNIMSMGIPVDYNGIDWNNLTEVEKLKNSKLYSLSQEYIRIQSELIERPFNELADELKLEVITDNNKNIIGYKIKDRNALMDIIVSSQKSRNISDNVIASLNSLRDEQISIEQVLNKEKVEQIMNALVNNRVVKEKRKGEMSPQVASSLFEYEKADIFVNTASRFVNVGTKKNVNFAKLLSPLKTYRKGFDGTTLPAEAMIALPKQWNKWIKETYPDGLDGLNKELDSLHKKLYEIEEKGKTDVTLNEQEENLKNLITIIGFRIPNQGMNSSDYMRIRRFLPIESANAVVVPSEMIPKAGSDFDIDKLNIYLTNYASPKYNSKTQKWEAPKYTKYLTKENSTDEERYNNYVDSSKYELTDKVKRETGISNIEETLAEKALVFSLEKEKVFNDLKEYKTEVNILKDKLNSIKGNQKEISSSLELSNQLFNYLPNSIKEIYKNVHSENNDLLTNTILSVSITKDLLNNITKVYDSLNSSVKELYENEDFLKFTLESFLSSAEDVVNTISNKKLIGNIYESINANVEERSKLYDTMTELTEAFVEEKGSMVDQIKTIIRDTKIKDLNLLSKEDFLKQSIEEQNTKTALENRMIEVRSELISNPINFRQLMAPISDAILNDRDFGIVWDMRFIQDTDTVKVNGKDVIAFHELMKRREEILKTKVFKTQNGARVLDIDNVKGFLDKDGKLNTNKNLIISDKIDINKVVLNDNAKKMFDDQVAVVYQELRRQWYDGSAKKFKEGNLAQVNSSVTNMYKFIEFISGKAGGVGQSAVHITNHQLAVASNLYLNNTDPLWIFDHNTVNINGVEYPSFANIRGKDGELISETLSAFLNAYVDVAKDPYIYSINAVSKTANMTFMMIRAGAPIQWVGRFLSQPSIKSLLEKQTINESMFVKASGLQEYNSTIIDNVKSNYSTIKSLHKGREQYDREYSDRYDELVIENRLNELEPYNYEPSFDEKVQWAEIQDLQKAGLFSYEKLGEYIAYDTAMNDGVEIPENLKYIGEYYGKAQAVILDLYLEYQRQAKHFQSLIRAANADTSGIGQSRKAIENSLNETKRVLQSKMFGNAEKMIDNTIVRKFQQVKERTLDMYSTMYLVDKTPVLKKVQLKLYDLYSSTQPSAKEKLKLDNTISNDMIMALMSINYPDKGNVTKDVYESLFVPTEEKAKYRDINGKAISLPQLINNLMDKKATKGESSDAVKMLWKLRNNKLMKNLSGYVTTTPKSSYKDYQFKTDIVIGKPSINYIRYNNNKGITEDLNAKTEALQEIKENFPDFYNDLITYAVFQNGFNVTPNSFVNDIPNVDIMAIKTDAIDRFLDLTEEQQEDVLEQFMSQFKRRNLKYAPTVSSITKYYEDKYKGGFRKGASVGTSDVVPALVGDIIAEIPVNRFSDYEVLSKVVKNKNGTYSRVGVEGKRNDRGYFDFLKGFKRPIVGEESYFTGYDIELRNPEEANKRSLKRFEVARRLEEKRQEKIEREKEKRSSGIDNYPMSKVMNADENIYNKKTSTLDLIEEGLRTSTTRSMSLGNPGKLVTFENQPQLYVVTDTYKITEEMVNNPEWVKQWSEKEGWTTDYFYKQLNNPTNKTVKIGSWVTLYEKITDESGIINQPRIEINKEIKNTIDKTNLKEENYEIVLINGVQTLVVLSRMPKTIKKGSSVFYSDFNNSLGLIKRVGKKLIVPGFEDIQLMLDQEDKVVIELSTGFSIPTQETTQKKIISELENIFKTKNIRSVLEKTKKINANNPDVVISKLTQPSTEDVPFSPITDTGINDAKELARQALEKAKRNDCNS